MLRNYIQDLALKQDAITEALLVIIETNRVLQQRFELVRKDWIELIETYCRKTPLDENQKKALFNTFLFFCAHPSLSITLENMESIFSKIVENFHTPKSCIPCFCEERFHELPLDFIHTVGHLILEDSIEAPLKLKNVLLYYRFVELICRTGIEQIYIKHVRYYVSLRAEEFQLRHSAVADSSDVVADELVTVRAKGAELGHVLNTVQIFSDHVRPEMLAKILETRDHILDGGYLLAPDCSGIELILTQVTLLLMSPRCARQVNEHCVHELRKLILKLKISDVANQTALTVGVLPALETKMRALSPAGTLTKSLGSAFVAEQEESEAEQEESEAEQEGSEAEQEACSSGDHSQPDDVFFRELDLHVGKYLAERKVGDVAAMSGKVPPYLRQIISPDDYSTFLWDSALQKIKSPARWIDIKEQQLSKVDQKCVKNRLLKKVKHAVRRQHTTFKDLARRAVTSRSRAFVGWQDLHGESKPKYTHPLSIFPETNGRQTKRQADQTCRMATDIRAALGLRPFKIKGGGTLNYTDEMITSCFSSARVFSPFLKRSLYIAAISGRTDTPVGQLKSDAACFSLIDPETDQDFDRAGHYARVLPEKYLYADYPRSLKPFLFVLGTALNELEKQRAVGSGYVGFTLNDVFADALDGLRELLPQLGHLKDIFLSTRCEIFVTAAFRGKQAILIKALDADINSLIQLCNLLNELQEDCVCTVMDNLPKNENQVLSALLRIEQNSTAVLQNKDINIQPTTSMCAELSLIPAMGLMISLFGISPQGILNAPISSRKHEGHEMQVGEHTLWKPCAKNCEPRREIDTLLLEISRDSSIWQDFLMVLYDGCVPSVLTGLADLCDSTRREIGLEMLRNNQEFAKWASKQPNFRALLVTKSSESLCRSISIDSTVSSISDQGDRFLELVTQLLTEQRANILFSFLTVKCQPGDFLSPPSSPSRRAGSLPSSPLRTVDSLPSSPPRPVGSLLSSPLCTVGSPPSSPPRTIGSLRVPHPLSRLRFTRETPLVAGQPGILHLFSEIPTRTSPTNNAFTSNAPTNNTFTL